MKVAQTFILIPAYNEEKALQKLLPDIAAVMGKTGRSYEICVVNDGSRDRTLGLLNELKSRLPLEALSHASNQGYGAALATGYCQLAKRVQFDDAVVSLDADNTHPPSYIPALIRKLEEGFDVVMTSYWIAGAHAYGVPLPRRIMSRVANGLFRILFPIDGTRTYTNGFRAYRGAMLKRLEQRWENRLIEEAGFAGGTELFLKARALGAKVTEIPFDLHYENRGGESKIRIGRTIATYLTLATRARAF